jgi:hypothetical protein
LESAQWFFTPQLFLWDRRFFMTGSFNILFPGHRLGDRR